MFILPIIPEPTEIEIEVTNHCNANCVACPRDKLGVKKGMMSMKTFRYIIDKFEKYRDEMKINIYTQKYEYPIVTFAGMGEPLLNENIFKFIRYASDKKFHTVIFTNASLLDQEKAHELINSGINRIYISFWGIEREEYELSMGLDYNKSLRNVEYLAKIVKDKGIPITITWVKNPKIKSTPLEIKKFWNDKGLEVDDDNTPWNRGGNLEASEIDVKFEKFINVDLEKEIWCSQMYFTDTICWDGDIILCSCDYYMKENVVGNLNEMDIEETHNNKKNILISKKLPSLCKMCKKGDRNYIFGSEPWDNILSKEERDKYMY